MSGEAHTHSMDAAMVRLPCVVCFLAVLGVAVLMGGHLRAWLAGLRVWVRAHAFRVWFNDAGSWQSRYCRHTPKLEWWPRCHARS